MSKEFYLVISTFYDSGKVTATLHTETHEEKPANTSTSNTKYDCYYDWFDTWEEAAKFKKEALNA